MEIAFSSRVLEKLQDIEKRQPKTYKRIQKQLVLFDKNPTHPSLRTHKLKGKLDSTWSISIERDLRMLYKFTDSGIIFFDIGTHDEVYKN